MAFTLDDILNIQPSVVSRDLSSYIIYLYGKNKIGKTTIAKDMGALILACEDGTRAMAGAYAQIIQSWNDIKSIAKLAKNERFKERYKAIAIDTIDQAYTLCEKWVCSQNGVNKINEIPYGGGWTQIRKELNNVFGGLTLLGYAVLFISHDTEKTFTRPNGTEYTRIVPTMPEKSSRIIEDMSDIIVYGYTDWQTNERIMVLRDDDGTINCGSRFPYMTSRIPFGYEPLVQALNDAIDKEAEMSGAESVITERIHRKAPIEFNYDELMNSFYAIINYLSSLPNFAEFWAERITEITDRVLGKGKKVNQCTRDQAEVLSLVVDELNALLEENNITIE